MVAQLGFSSWLGCLHWPSRDSTVYLYPVPAQRRSVSIAETCHWLLPDSLGSLTPGSLIRSSLQESSCGGLIRLTRTAYITGIFNQLYHIILAQCGAQKCRDWLKSCKGDDHITCLASPPTSGSLVNSGNETYDRKMSFVSSLKLFAYCPNSDFGIVMIYCDSNPKLVLKNR